MLKILSYNVHQGLSALRKVDVTRDIASLLKTSGADIVCLQEVWQKHGVSEQQLEKMADNNWDFQIYERNAVFPAGSQGNAILSRFPIIRYRNVDISLFPFEQRGFLHAELSVGGTLLHVICVHLGLVRYERHYQLKEMSLYVEKNTKHSEPLIVAGDFNDWRKRDVKPYAQTMELEEAMVASTGSYARTYPAYLPLLSLDRIYFRNLRLELAQPKRPSFLPGLSDHIPLECAFSFPPAARTKSPP